MTRGKAIIQLLKKGRDPIGLLVYVVGVTSIGAIFQPFHRIDIIGNMLFSVMFGLFGLALSIAIGVILHDIWKEYSILRNTEMVENRLES